MSTFLYKRDLGLAAPELGWVPTPTYLLRRALILKLIEGFKPGRTLEIGCGSGALFYDLSKLGFSGICVEKSAQARQIASILLSSVQNCQITEDLAEVAAIDFDYVFSFEVLEHIDDDSEALAEWVRRLRKGGKLVISVPGHRSKWSQSDEWAGHFRRYERSEIARLLQKSGLENIKVFSYGWPLSKLIEPVRATVHGKQLKKQLRTMATNGEARNVRTSRSGIDRSVESKFYPLYSSTLGRVILGFCAYLQDCAKYNDWGTGYLIEGRKS